MALLGINPSDAPPTVLNNATSAGGYSATTDLVSCAYASEILSGALTATVYKKILDVTGAGRISGLKGYVKDATSRTLGVKLVIDGQATACYDSTSAAITALGAGAIIIDGVGGAGNYACGASETQTYTTGFSVWVKSSLSETDKVAIQCKYTEVG